jgi:hypothetical protein
MMDLRTRILEDEQAPQANAAPAQPSAPVNTSTSNIDDLSSLLGARMIKNVKGIKKNLLYGERIKPKKVVFIK